MVNRSPAVADKSNCADAADEMCFLVIEQLPGTNKACGCDRNNGNPEKDEVYIPQAANGEPIAGRNAFVGDGRRSVNHLYSCFC